MRPLSSTQTLSSVIEGSFAGLTEQQIASALVVQQAGGTLELGDNLGLIDVGSLADVETPIPLTNIPEPASMILLGSGLLYLARRKVLRLEYLNASEARFLPGPPLTALAARSLATRGLSDTDVSWQPFCTTRDTLSAISADLRDSR